MAMDGFPDLITLIYFIAMYCNLDRLLKQDKGSHHVGYLSQSSACESHSSSQQPGHDTPHTAGLSTGPALHSDQSNQVASSLHR